MNTNYKYLFEFSKTSTEDGIIIESYKGENKNVVIPQEIENLPITEIGDSAFSDSNIESIILPETLQTIRAFAFSYTENLKTLTIPDSVIFIEECAFANSAIETIKFSKNVHIIEPALFEGCNNLKEIENLSDTLLFTLPIGEKTAFSGCPLDNYTLLSDLGY